MFDAGNQIGTKDRQAKPLTQVLCSNCDTSVTGRLRVTFGYHRVCISLTIVFWDFLVVAPCRIDCLAVALSVQLWVTSTRHHYPRITGWKFFTVNRPFILSLMGVIVTYTVIIIQMNPDLMMKLQSNM